MRLLLGSPESWADGLIAVQENVCHEVSMSNEDSVSSTHGFGASKTEPQPSRQRPAMRGGRQHATTMGHGLQLLLCDVRESAVLGRVTDLRPGWEADQG